MPRLTRRAEDGFSLFVVLMALFAMSMFVAAAFAAANGNLGGSGDSRDRKVALAAAEAGLNWYQSRLNLDPDFWTRCTNITVPGGTTNPVNQLGAASPRWRNVPGAASQYMIELVPATPGGSCQENNNLSMITANATFRIKVTGRARDGGRVRRALIGTFRRSSFLNYLWATDYETADPRNYPTVAEQDDADDDCAGRYRSARSGCDEIQFGNKDKLLGPVHTNDDSLLTCRGTDGPIFGRTLADPVEVGGVSPGYTPACGGLPVFNGTRIYNSRTFVWPSTNQELESIADAAYVFTGPTEVRLDSASDTMTVKNGGTTRTLVALPPKGIIYVRNGTGTCPTNPPPVIADYNDAAACGNLYVSGTYDKNLTFAAQNDIIIGPPYATNNGLIRTGDAVAGLVADNFVRVYHKVSGCSNASTMGDVTIDAAILALQHSFTVDNFRCGSPLGSLTVNGAIAQRYRGAVATSYSGNVVTGYDKNYNYDNRFGYRSPPNFIEPVDASWSVARLNEAVPAR